MVKLNAVDCAAADLAKAVSAGAGFGRGGSEVAADIAENKSCLSSLVPTAGWSVLSVARARRPLPGTSSSGPG